MTAMDILIFSPYVVVPAAVVAAVILFRGSK